MISDIRHSSAAPVAAPMGAVAAVVVRVSVVGPRLARASHRPSLVGGRRYEPNPPRADMKGGL